MGDFVTKMCIYYFVSALYKCFDRVLVWRINRSLDEIYDNLVLLRQIAWLNIMKLCPKV